MALDVQREVEKDKRLHCSTENLPADQIIPEHFANYFSKHERINRFVVPPTKVMALVEYAVKAKRRGLA